MAISLHDQDRLRVDDAEVAQSDAEVAQSEDFALNDELPVQELQASVSVVIPAMNEAKNISWVLLGIPEWVAEVIVVDGNSTDGTDQVALAARPDVVIIPDPGEGKGAALRAGFDAAKGDFIIMLDADGSMDPSEIGRYAGALSSNFDLVKGSRFLTGGGSTDITALRRMGNGALRILVNRLWGANFSDLCYGYCGFRRSCLPILALRSDGFEIETELTIQALNAKLRICEVPSMEAPRGHGVSNLNTFSDGFRVLRMMMAGRLTPKGTGGSRTPTLGLPAVRRASHQ